MISTDKTGSTQTSLKKQSNNRAGRALVAQILVEDLVAIRILQVMMQNFPISLNHYSVAPKRGEARRNIVGRIIVQSFIYHCLMSTKHISKRLPLMVNMSE